MKVVVDDLIGELEFHLAPLLALRSNQQWFNTSSSSSEACDTALVAEMLLVASIRGAGSVVERLARAHRLSGSTVCDQHGRTAMHYCCHHGLNAGISLLTYYEGDAWAGDSTSDSLFGTLPVELALRNGSVETLKLVLRKMQVRPPKQQDLALQ